MVPGSFCASNAMVETCEKGSRRRLAPLGQPSGIGISCLVMLTNRLSSHGFFFRLTTFIKLVILW